MSAVSDCEEEPTLTRAPVKEPVKLTPRGPFDGGGPKARNVTVAPSPPREGKGGGKATKKKKGPSAFIQKKIAERRAAKAAKKEKAAP